MSVAQTLEFLFFAATGVPALVPLVGDLFGTPTKPQDPDLGFDINTVRVSVGVNNTNAGPHTLNGTLPDVTIYDVSGEIIDYIQGFFALDNKKTLPFDRPGQFSELTLKGRQGIEYVRISAGQGAPICISWIATASSSNDFQGWNGGFGARCGLPNYPSVSTIPGVDFRPPCVWLSQSDDNVFPKGLSYRVVDFMPPAGRTSDNQTPDQKSLATQWNTDSDTLCKAPGRMQFWDFSKVSDCVPFFPKPLEFVNGTDKDKDVLMNGHRQKCNNDFTHNHLVIYDMDGKPVQTRETEPGFHGATTDPKALQALNQQVQEAKDNGAVFSSTINLGPLVKPPKQRRRVGKRGDGMEFIRARSDADEKCIRELVVHNQADISVRDLCDSSTTWGPDMASDAERLYCDMCTHEAHSYCNSAEETWCWDENKNELRMPASRKRSDGSVYPLGKRFEVVHHWD
jgi:hypothetical protein